MNEHVEQRILLGGEFQHLFFVMMKERNVSHENRERVAFFHPKHLRGEMVHLIVPAPYPETCIAYASYAQQLAVPGIEELQVVRYHTVDDHRRVGFERFLFN